MKIKTLTLFLLFSIPNVIFAQWSIATFSGDTFVGRISTINERFILVKSNKIESQIELSAIKSFERESYKHNYDDIITWSKSSRIDCEIWGLADSRIFFSTPNKTILSLPMEEVNYYQADTIFFNISSTTSQPTSVNSNSLINQAGQHLNQSANMQLIGILFMGVAFPFAQVEPMAGVAVGIIGVGLQIGSIIQKKMAGQKLIQVETK